MAAAVKSWVNQVTSHGQPQALFNLRTKDPILRLFNRLGFEIELYTPRPCPWNELPRHMGVLTAWLGVIVLFLWMNRASSGIVRQFAGMAALGGIVGFTPVYGKTGIGLVDFGVPALAFLAALHLVDVFFLREPQETKDWTFARMYVEIMAFPRDPSEASDHPRWDSAKGLGINVIKLLMVNILVYSCPTASQVRKVKHWFPWVMYHANAGMIILLLLGAVVEGTLRIYGIIFGYEMKPLFNNPQWSSNPREFWGKWNLAVKEGLHTATFRAKAKKQKERRAKVTSVAKSRGEKPPPDRFRHMDAMSETDMSGAEDKVVAKGKGKAKANGGPPAQEKKRSTKSFARKAAAAAFTFFISGASHEFMNHMAFDGLSGLNLAFFGAHAAATIIYTMILRNYPAAARNTPWIVGFLIVNAFSIITAPLFTVPFLRASFFDDYKVFGCFGAVNAMVYTFGK